VIGVSVSGAVADRIGLGTTLALFPVIILAAVVIFSLVRSPSRE